MLSLHNQYFHQTKRLLSCTAEVYNRVLFFKILWTIQEIKVIPIQKKVVTKKPVKRKCMVSLVLYFQFKGFNNETKDVRYFFNLKVETETRKIRLKLNYLLFECGGCITCTISGVNLTFF